MGTRIHLYALPGLPLSVEDLMPQSLLARCAGGLVAHGHTTFVFDGGSLEQLALPELDALTAATRGLPPRGAHGIFPLRSRRAARCATALSLARVRQLLSHPAAQGAPAICAIQVQRQKDVAGSRMLARALRSKWPNTCIAVAGAFVDTYGRTLLAGANDFDVACVGPAESVLAGLARSMQDGGNPEHLPGLLYRKGGRVLAGSLGLRPLATDFAPANYHPSVYTGLLDGGKIKLFSIVHSTGLDHVGHYRGTRVQPAIHVRDSRQLRAELMQLHELYGARVFHVSGEHTPQQAIGQFATECMSLPFDMVYSRDGHVLEMTPDLAAGLVQSGCHAAGFRLLTGSQRLLSDFYGENWNISTAEACIRSFRDEGCYIHIGLTYPCPADDYHSHAESVRILRRCRPDGVYLQLPELPPGSAWRQSAKEFGFDVCPVTLERWITGECRRTARQFPYAEPPFSINGQKGRQISRQISALRSELTDIPVSESPSVSTCLMARVSGLGSAFLNQFLPAITALDIEQLYDTIEFFNTRATASIATVGLNPVVPVRKAVGN